MFMPTRSVWQLVAAVAFAASCTGAVAHGFDSNEPVLRAAVLQACWPNDVIRLADEYLRRHADAPQAPDVALRRERATVALAALRRVDVQLFRQGFADAAGSGEATQDDVRRAAIGDLAAIRRLADSLAATAGSRWLGWLQYGSALGDKDAAYALAVHYRRQNQPWFAQIYEARALELGFDPPPTLAHARK